MLWKSHKRERGSHSSCKAEIKETDECMKNVQWFWHLLVELNLLQQSKMTPIYNDNQGTIDWANASSMKGMRHANIRENCVHEAVHEFHEITVLHIGRRMNPADLFMKDHKLDEIFHSLHDLVVSPACLDGGCWEPLVCSKELG